MGRYRRPREFSSLRPIAAALVVSVCTGSFPASAADTAVTVFAEGRPCVYLDIGEQRAGELGIGKAVDDLLRCFEGMTGHELPRTGGRPRLFDPTGSEAIRFECEVVSLQDQSRYGGPNAQVGLVLSPNRRFERSPFAESGEKVGWTCTWHKSGRKLFFHLTVAAQAYYGPGHGPFTFAELASPAPDFTEGDGLRLALEMRNSPEGCLRGGYSLDGGGEWAYTDWFEPTQAGTDEREPGRSDKNGPQRWGADWPERWGKGTAFYLTAYHPKGREASVTLGDVRVGRSGEALFADSFSTNAGEGSGLIDWALAPTAGSVSIRAGWAVLKPEHGGWNTVGLRAQQEAALDTASLLPLTVELRGVHATGERHDAQRDQSFAIEVSRDDGIALRASTPLGLQNAIHHLLHGWGCRWVMPGELGECIPSQTRLTLPVGAVRAGSYGDTAVDTSPFGDWYARNLGGWEKWLSGQHYWFYAIPPDRYVSDHPEWYSLVGGRRQPRQLCSTNPEVVATMIKAANDFLRRRPQAVSFPMDPQDNIDFCQCASCVGLDIPGATTRGVPSVTDRVLTFVNAVAAGIEDEFPERVVAFYAYWSHIDPPVRVKPVANVTVIVCRSSNCLLHLTPTKSCPTSDFHTLVARWRGLTPNVYSYEYDPISWTGGLPCPVYLAMGHSLKHLFTKTGIKGSYSDGARAATHASTYVNRYMARRMKVDPTQDPEEVLRDMCRHFFGPAAESMELYYRELAKVTESTHDGRGRVGGGTTFYHDIFSPLIVRAARTHLDRALGLCTAESLYRRRVHMVDMSQRYLEAYLDGVWNAQAHRYAAAVAAFDRVDALIDEMGGSGWVYTVDARRRARTMRMKALVEHFPEEFGFVTRWRLLGPFDNSMRNADMVRDDFEPIRSVEDSVNADDGAQLQWRDYESPGGFLNLEKAFSDEPKAWTLSYAYAGMTYNAEQEAVAQLKMDSFFPFRAFVNGEQVYYRPGLDADCPDKRTADAVLRRGKNTIVFKLTQTQSTADTYPWGLYFRIIVEGRAATALPEQWLFKTDPDDVGQRESWYSLELDDGDWVRLPVPSAWEKTIGAYDGYGWYRARFRVPGGVEGKAMVLKFRGVDEQAWVYLNGELLGERTARSTGKGVGEIWDKPFGIPVPAGRLRPGDENILAVRVHDSAYAGGLFGAVRLLVAE